MKVLVRGQLYVVVEAYGDHLEVKVDDGVTALIPYDEPTLIVDPTDDDLSEARDVLLQCQHANYITVDIPNRVHRCADCGSRFTDVRRAMRYWRTGKAMREQ